MLQRQSKGVLYSSLFFSFLFFSFLFFSFLFFSFLNTAWNAAWQLPYAVRVQAVNGTLCGLCWPPCALLIRGLEQNMFCTTRESYKAWADRLRKTQALTLVLLVWCRGGDTPARGASVQGEHAAAAATQLG